MKTLKKLFPVLRVRRGEELENSRDRRIWRIWNLAALLLSSLITTALSLALAIGNYRIVLFLGYFAHPSLLLLNWLPVLLLQLLLYCLLNRPWAAFLGTALPVLLASTGDYFMLKVRFAPLTFQDLDSIQEGLRVAGDYSLQLNSRILTAILWALLATPALALLARGRVRWSGRLIAGLLAVLAAVPLWTGIYANEELYLEQAQLNDHVHSLSTHAYFISNGFVYPFLHSIRQSSDVPPEGYDPEKAAALLEDYRNEDIPAERRVNVLVLQLESFGDLEAMGFTGVAPESYSVLRRLQEESISGTLVTDVIGGGTIHTEECVLTGYFQKPNITRDCQSYVRWFDDQDFFTTGSHPYRPDFYDRFNANRFLGFDEYLFSRDHYFALTNGMVHCDSVFLPEVFRLFREAVDGGRQVFSFNVSLQGHAPYTSPEIVAHSRLWLDKSISPETQYILNNYLTLVVETQELLWQQLETMRDYPEPVVVLIYGDHNPGFGDAQISAECGVSFDLSTEEGFLRYYGTPYLIWANNAAKEQLDSDFTGDGPAVSPCYLFRVLFDALGWQGSAFSQFSGRAMECLPVLSINGRYVENGVFTDVLSPQGAALLQDYRTIQYYMHRLPVKES